MELSPWSVLLAMQLHGEIAPNEKPTREQFERFRDGLYLAAERHHRRTGQRMFTNYYVPRGAKPVELADGTVVEF